MKKILSLIMVTFLLLGVFSCKKSSEGPHGYLIPGYEGKIEYVDNDGSVYFFEIEIWGGDKAKIIEDPRHLIAYSGELAFPALINYEGKEYLVTEIEEMAFKDCDSLFSVIIPNSVKIIGSCAFEGCDNLREVAVPISVKEIGSEAFSRCSMLSSIDIPFTVKKLSRAVFFGCGFKSFDVPDGITEIEGNAFGCCEELVSILIPDSVKKMGGDVFWNCDNLVTIICLADIPPTIFNHYGNYPFLGGGADPQEIRVPSASVDAYRTADGWKDYADKIVGI